MGATGALVVAGAAAGDADPPIGAANGDGGVCGTGCGAGGGTAPAAFAPAANPRPNSPPTPVCIARAA
ncbi:hypothetical protein ABFW11_13195 [Mycolicibacterium porcinum]|uniref:hypothetical protein n=1 Tax=Mycolicibacterium porcinum TaxID=39693 RepID=UPI0034CF156B